jgi:hypothetical protein
VSQGSRAVLPRAVPPTAAAGPSAGLAVLEYDSGMAGNKRTRRLIAAVVVLGLLVGASLLALLLNRDGNGGQQAAPGVSTAPVPEPKPPTSDAVPPPLTRAPSGVTWELFQGVALPTSRTDGPTRFDGPVHAGFSRTPTGALLAAAQVSYRSLVDPDINNLRRVAQAQLVEGPGKTAYLNLIGQLRENNSPAAGYAQIVGFRYLTYTPDVAVISLATRGNSGRLQVGSYTLRWVDGDWKLEKPASGLQQPQVVQDLAGYVLWSGAA